MEEDGPPEKPPDIVTFAYNKIYADIVLDETSNVFGDTNWRYRGLDHPAEIHPLATKWDPTLIDDMLLRRLAEHCSYWAQRPRPKRGLDPHAVQMIDAEVVFTTDVSATPSDVLTSIESLSKTLRNFRSGNEAQVIIEAALVLSDAFRLTLSDDAQVQFIRRVRQIVHDSTKCLNWGIPSRPKRDKMLLADTVLRTLEREKQGQRKSHRRRVAYRLGVLFGTEEDIPKGPTDGELAERFRKREMLFEQHEKKQMEAHGIETEQINYVPLLDARFNGKYTGPDYSHWIPADRFKLRVLRRRREREALRSSAKSAVVVTKAKRAKGKKAGRRTPARSRPSK